jgi:hypothetical protein
VPWIESGKTVGGERGSGEESTLAGCLSSLQPPFASCITCVVLRGVSQTDLRELDKPCEAQRSRSGERLWVNAERERAGPDSPHPGVTGMRAAKPTGFQPGVFTRYQRLHLCRHAQSETCSIEGRYHSIDRGSEDSVTPPVPARAPARRIGRPRPRGNSAHRCRGRRPISTVAIRLRRGRVPGALEK